MGSARRPVGSGCRDHDATREMARSQACRRAGYEERRAAIVDMDAHLLRAHQVERLRRIGLAYIDFARDERGLFSLAFAVQDEQPSAGIVTLDDEVVAPFQLLLDALDAMRDAGALDPAG